MDRLCSNTLNSWKKSLFFSICMVYYKQKEGETPMTKLQLEKRVAAVKTADAINAIEGAPVSDYAKKLSASWARGELTGEQMKAALLAYHKSIAAKAQSRA